MATWQEDVKRYWDKETITHREVDAIDQKIQAIAVNHILNRQCVAVLLLAGEVAKYKDEKKLPRELTTALQKRWKSTRDAGKRCK